MSAYDSSNDNMTIACGVTCGKASVVWVKCVVVLSVTMGASSTEAQRDNPEGDTNRDASQIH